MDDPIRILSEGEIDTVAGGLVVMPDPGFVVSDAKPEPGSSAFSFGVEREMRGENE